MQLVKRHSLLAILLLALVLRLAAAVAATMVVERAGRDFLIPGDARGYWLLAGQILQGEPYAIYDPPRRVLRMPGFPALLALIRGLTSSSLAGTRLLLAFVGTAACGAVFLLGRTLAGHAVGLIAALLAAIWPALVGFSVIVLTETAFALALTLSLATMAVVVRDEPRWRYGKLAAWAVLTGLLIAVASYIRPTWLPAAGIFPLILLVARRSPRALVLAGVIPLATAAAMFPWAWRNHAVTGHWVVTTLWVGPSLYDGLNPQATGASDMQFFEEDDLLLRMSEYEMDRTYRAWAWEFARTHPVRVLELALIKQGRYWRPWPVADQFDNWYSQLAVAGFYLPMVLVALVGAWVERRRLWLLGLTAGPILLFSLIHSIFVGSIRYRLPAEYPLCVLSAVGICWLVGQLGRGRAGEGEMGRRGRRWVADG